MSNVYCWYADNWHGAGLAAGRAPGNREALGKRVSATHHTFLRTSRGGCQGGDPATREDSVSDEIGRREFLKRSSLAGAAIVAGAPMTRAAADAGTVEAKPSPSAAVPDLAGLADRQLDSRDFCLSVYDAIQPSLTFEATDAASARAWQRRARARLVQRLGGFPAERVPLRAEVLETRDFGTYTREQVVFQTREHLSAIGYFLVPKGRTGRLPTVVCLPGHGRGVTDVLGLNDDGTPRAQRGVGYSKEYGLQCLEHGYAVFALEQLAFGARRDAPARAKGPGENSCRPAACAALLFGQTMIAWRTWDAMRTVDYLLTRPEVDPGRIATLGASGGGTISLFTAALDDRVRAGVVSAYFNTFRDSIVSLSHCPDNYVPGLLQDMEMYDIAGLVAPRCLFVESGRRDPIFPIAGSRTAAEKARRMYTAFAVPERFGYAIHDGAHEFDGVEAFAFMRRWV